MIQNNNEALPDLTVICCFNDRNKYEKLLLASLNIQTFKNFEIIAIDNEHNRFSSAAKALNYGVSVAKAPKVLIVHQDVKFNDEFQLQYLEKAIDKLGDHDIIGLAGALEDRNASLYKKFICRNKRVVSNLKPGNTRIDVESLDECLIGFKKNAWDSHHFSEELCEHWDLYAVEFCIYNKLEGGSCFVIPINASHLSPGRLGINFSKTLFKIMKHYKYKISRITSTCISVSTKHPCYSFCKLSIFNEINNFIKRK